MTAQLLTPAEVAALRGCSISTVCAACRDGTLRASRIGRAWAIDRRAAERWRPRPVGWRKGRPRVITTSAG